MAKQEKQCVSQRGSGGNFGVSAGSACISPGLVLCLGHQQAVPVQHRVSVLGKKIPSPSHLPRRPRSFPGGGHVQTPFETQ